MPFPNAFAFVTRPLAAPAGVESYVTSYNGVTLRVVRGYDMKYKKEMLSMDARQMELMGRNGRRLVMEKFAVDVVARQMVGLYQDVSGNG